MIEGKTQRDTTSSVVPGEREPGMTEGAHHLDHVTSDGPLGVPRVVCGMRRTPGPAVSPQVGTDHGETASDEERGNAMPGRRCPGMAVQQHHRRPFPTVANENRCFIDLDPPSLKALEQGPDLPPSLTHRHGTYRPRTDNPVLAHTDHRANRLRKLAPFADEC
ncbi:hypothetical protein GCM10010206_65950 [Streptomyces cinerochromogenes]|nr:hypothetical protein GCM10010206_65950 [Streptomyces cinerochromogenes]